MTLDELIDILLAPYLHEKELSELCKKIMGINSSIGYKPNVYITNPSCEGISPGMCFKIDNVEYFDGDIYIKAEW